MTDTTTSDLVNPPSDNRNVSIIALSIIAIGIGVVTGIGAIVLRYLISVIHNFFFLGIFSFD